MKQSRYRRSEIALLHRENELLDILKWSHEEYLKEAEDFYRRERAYRTALDARSISGNPENNFTRERLLQLKDRLLVLKSYYIDQLLRFSDEN